MKKNVILLLGDDAVSKNSFLDDWIAKNMPAEARSFDLDILFGGELAGEELVNRCLAFPMMAKRRCVVVRQAHKMRSLEAQAMAAYTQNPSPSTLLLLEAESADRREKAWKTIADHAEVLEYRVPYPEKIPSWIVQRAREKYRRKMDATAAQILFDCVGGDLSELDGELNKLDIVLEQGKSVVPDHIRQIVGRRADDVFAWLQAMGERNTGKAMLLVSDLLETEGNVVRPLSLLARHFYMLLRIRLLLGKNPDEKAIADELGLNHYFYFVKLGFGRQAQHYSAGELERALEKITQADRLAKSESFKENLLLEALVFDCCKR